MTANLWRFPVGPLRDSAVTAKLCAFVVVAVAAFLLRGPLHLGGLYPLKTLTLFAAMMALAVGFLDRYHPFSRFGAANQVTTARAGLVALMGGLIGEQTLPIVEMSAAVTGLVVVLLDGVDGWAARRTQMESQFGARFDMEIDAVLILALAALAWKLDKAGPWVLLSGGMRYLFVAAGWLATWLQQPLPYSRRRQTVCVVQILALTLVLVPLVESMVSSTIAAVALLVLTFSFLVDLVWLWRHRFAVVPNLVQERGALRA